MTTYPVVSLIKEFCLNKCEYLLIILLFFNELEKTDKQTLISKYYIKDDVHFNALGNEKLYQNFIESFKY